MKRSIQRASGALASSSSSAAFICSRCRIQALRLPYTGRAQVARLHATTKAPVAEGLRKKLWGDNPPGPKDPYAPRESDALVDQEPNAIAQSGEQEANGLSAENDQALLVGSEDYVAAKTWDDLERIGGPSGWWEKSWDEENQFKGFNTGKRVNAEAIQPTVKRAFIEILALRDAGLPINHVTRGAESTTFDFEQVSLHHKDGRPQLEFEHEELRQELMSSIEETQADGGSGSVTYEKAGTPASASQTSVNMGASATQTSQPDWFKTSISDHDDMPNFKFVLIKRVMQLTGARISDPAIARIENVGHLVSELLEKPKPKKLADILLARADLMALPNLEIFPHRHTPIDKEKEVGRWKVIEKELEERGLPVTGHS